MEFDAKKLAKLRDKPKELIKLINNRDQDFMNYLKTFENKKEIQEVLKEEYDIAIYTVGFSIYPLLFSLKVANPKEKAIFFYTKASSKFKEVFDEFKKEFNLDFEIKHRTTESSSDTAEIYHEIERVLRKHRNKKIAIDITGGKKPTIAAGFFGASLHSDENDIDILYMDFSEYKNDIPVYGSEFITILLNPNDIFSAVERKELEELFDSGQYRAARRFSKRIRDRLKAILKKMKSYDLDEQLAEIKKIYYFSKLYELRNDFNYEECIIREEYLTKAEIKGISKLKKAYSKITDLEDELLSKGYRGIDVSTQLTRRLHNRFKDDDSCLYLALDRYISALRYKNIDYQSYILRLVSVLELAGTIYTKGRSELLKDKLKIVPDYELRYKLNELKNTRNNLSLIHGFRVVSAPKLDYEVAVLNYICLAFDVDKQMVENIIEKELKFRNFNEII
ncbi:hypothetical protein [Thermohalobacter berrensis]|uniref:CRISPR-associated protein n=1 Tax=Thermohalobacter berrensis TaxID=99594 RepID=A0A419T1J0_9FIRM|nr:hypothetical protein [Thermohalobacter berrensis]RKD31281.1 hypothetical protein BET03_03900 [Thermohalobacter berrensis]